MLELLKQLCLLNGVSGDEGEVRAFLRAQAEPYADSIRTDALGHKGSTPDQSCQNRQHVLPHTIDFHLTCSCVFPMVYYIKSAPGIKAVSGTTFCILALG